MRITGECCICTLTVPLIQITCGHALHLECAKSMITACCPICRYNLTEDDVPKEILDSIRRQHSQYQSETEQEYHRQLLEASRRRNKTQDIIRFILLALQALRSNGLPLRYMPREIRVEYDPNSPTPPIGEVIIMSVLEHFVGVISTQVEINPSVEDNEDDDDNPFAEENIELVAIQHQLIVGPI